MKLDKKQAIARRNQELGGAVLGVNNCHFTELNRNRNIWWFDIPVSRLAVGQYEWIHLLMHTPDTDELLHLKVPTVFLREKLEGLVVRNEGKRKAALSLELSADKDSFLQDMRPAGTNVNFAPFRTGDLSPAEYEQMRRHPSAGYRILNEARLYTNIPLDVCVHHHERVDGKGYPFGLFENEISVHAKIAAICDTYDSLTSPRPNHLAWSPARAMEYIAVRVDTLFDRRVFKAFTRTVGIYPLGTVLRLRSGRLAVVCGQNANEPLRPRVMTFYSVSQSAPLPHEVLDLTQSEDSVIAFEDARQWGFTDEQLMAMYAPHVK